MNALRINMLVPSERERAIKDALKLVDINAMVCMNTRGYGGHPNFYANNWTNEIVLFELFVSNQQLLPTIRDKFREVCAIDSESGCVFVTSEVAELFPAGSYT